MYILLLLFPYPAVLSRRKKGDRVALWTREKKNKQANLHIWYVD